MTQLQKNKRKRKSVNAKIEKIKSDFPDIDFKNMEIKRAYENHYSLTKELIYLEVDIKFCEIENRRQMCSNCNCWKFGASTYC